MARLDIALGRLNATSPRTYAPLTQIATVLIAAALGIVAVVQVVLCGSFHATCANSPMSYVEEWVADHRNVVLALAVSYALAVIVLFAQEIPGALRSSIKPHFTLRAALYIAAIVGVLILATHFPAVSSLLR